MKITISTWHPSAIIPLQDCFSKYSGYNFEWISSFEATVDLNTDNVGVLVKVMELIFISLTSSQSTTSVKTHQQLNPSLFSPKLVLHQLTPGIIG